jgi:DNA-binding HxlR family transcriptional regulator
MGYSDYQSTLVEIEYSMTPEQLEQANVLLTSWGDKYKPAE